MQRVTGLKHPLGACTVPRSLLMTLQDSKDLLHTSRKEFSKIEAQLAAKFEDIQAVCTKFSTVGRPEGWWEIVKGVHAPCSTRCALSTCMTKIVSPARKPHLIGTGHCAITPGQAQCTRALHCTVYAAALNTASLASAAGAEPILGRVHRHLREAGDHQGRGLQRSREGPQQLQTQACTDAGADSLMG